MPRHPGTLLKIYIYGYLNRVQSSRRLEREAQRNVELIWLTGRLAPDFKTIADFRRGNALGIRKVCGQFVEMCRAELDRADRDPSLVPEERVEHLKEKIATVRKQMKKLKGIGRELGRRPISRCR